MLELPEKRERPEPFRFRLSGIGEGDTPYNGIEGEAPPVHFERGTFFRVFNAAGVQDQFES